MGVGTTTTTTITITVVIQVKGTKQPKVIRRLKATSLVAIVLKATKRLKVTNPRVISPAATSHGAIKAIVLRGNEFKGTNPKAINQEATSHEEIKAVNPVVTNPAVKRSN